jgi:hypothetical protein
MLAFPFYSPFFAFFVSIFHYFFPLFQFDFYFLLSFLFPLLFHLCFVVVFRLVWVSSLAYPNLLRIKKLGCCCCKLNVYFHVLKALHPITSSINVSLINLFAHSTGIMFNLIVHMWLTKAEPQLSDKMEHDIRKCILDQLLNLGNRINTPSKDRQEKI